MLSKLQMIFSRNKPASSARDIEHGISQPSSTPAEPEVHVDHDGRPNIAADDLLNLFRHLTGIISHPSMVHSHFASGGRPAPNLGIYARVVHNEQRAKMGYKYFSWLINGCLGLQIIVAAALTAMGAAGASRSAVTVFGAINTVIAGVLTFLKGSGLPNRLKYYQAEWKRVREFIEQRERDFGQPGCDLDLYAVVGMVENMYEEVKIDLEASTPDRFAGFGSARKGQLPEPMTTNHVPVPLAVPRLGDNFSSNVKKFESGLGVVDSDIRDGAKNIQTQAKEGGERIESSFNEKVKDLASKAHQVVQDFQAQRHNEVESLGNQSSDYAHRLQQTVASQVERPITITLGGETHGSDAKP
jgi:hypothetical protein